MADWNDPATWAQSDNVRNGRPLLWNGQPDPTFGQSLNYLDGRAFARILEFDGITELKHWASRAFKIYQIPNTTPSAETLVIGCGFGWLIEVIIDAGSNAVWGCDISTLIQGALTTAGVRADVQPLILNIDFTASDAVTQFRTAGAGGTGQNRGKFDWVITEHLLEDWPIGDIQNALDSCDALRGNNPGGVAHFVLCQDNLQPGQSDPAIIANQFTLAEWVALRPSHWWVDAATGVIGGGT